MIKIHGYYKNTGNLEKNRKIMKINHNPTAVGEIIYFKNSFLLLKSLWLYF